MTERESLIEKAAREIAEGIRDDVDQLTTAAGEPDVGALITYNAAILTRIFGEEPQREDGPLMEDGPQIDYMQWRLNGGPYCFHVEDGRFCGRAKRWDGHEDIHPFTDRPHVCYPVDGYEATPPSTTGPTEPTYTADEVSHAIFRATGMGVGKVGVILRVLAAEHAVREAAKDDDPMNGHEESENCFCNPTVEDHGNGAKVIIHNRLDN